MLLTPVDFNYLSVDALLDSLHSFIVVRTVSPYNIVKELDPTTIKLQVANSKLEAPTKLVQLLFEIGDWTFKATFIVATKITGPILGLTFRKSKSAILDVSLALLHFPHLTYGNSADDNERVSRNLKHQTVLRRQPGSGCDLPINRLKLKNLSTRH